jgi:lysophospholipase L1-like esterase
MVADRVGPWANASADGFMYDALHPTAAGYADFARLIANALISA